MKVVSCLLLVTSVLRVFGGFPYTWTSSSPPKFIRRKCLVAWTVTYTLLATGLVVISLTHFHFQDFGVTKLIMKNTLNVLNKSWLFSIFCLIVYSSYRHTDLVQILECLFRMSVSPPHRYRLGKNEVAIVVCALTLAVLHHVAFLVLQLCIIDCMALESSIIFMVCEIFLDAIMFMFPLLLYLVFKLAACVLDHRVFLCSCCTNTNRETHQTTPGDHEINIIPHYSFLPHHKTKPTLPAHTPTEATNCAELLGGHHITTQDLTDLRNYIFDYNTILEKLVTYVQFPVVVMLVNEMLYLTITSYFVITGDTTIASLWTGLTFSLASFLRLALTVTSPQHVTGEGAKCASNRRVCDDNSGTIWHSRHELDATSSQLS